jgi:hypothetical protein
VVEAAAETRRQLELTRESLEVNVDRLVARARAELDWKARLRRDLPQIIAIGTGLVAVGIAGVVLRRRLRGRRKDGLVIDDFSTMKAGDIAKELRALREEIEKQREGSSSPLLKLATAAVTAGASAAGRAAASRVVDRSIEEPGKAA